MKRILLAAVMTLAAVQAREVDTGLAAMRERLRGHPVVQRNFSARQQRAALASGALAETAAALERSDGRDLGYLRERLLAASRTLEADFAAIEAKLAGLGLPEKTAAWREFVQHYRTRLTEVDRELASLAAGGLSQEALRTRLAALRAKFGGSGGSIQETVKWDMPPGLSAAAVGDWPEAYATAADDVPGPADLAETKVVQLTPEIRAKAAALGGNAAALNTWVATHIEFVSYFGQMQNSQAVLLSGHANDFDQATLLIALLRASGIPARYYFADVALSPQDVKDWVGSKDLEAALRVLRRSSERDGEKIVTGLMWVEAWLESGSGKRWMALYPSLKRRTYQPGIELARPAYDRMPYLKAVQQVLPAEPYLDAMRADLYRRFPGRGFNEVPFTGTLLAPPAPSPEPLFPVRRVRIHASELTASMQHRISLSLSDYFSRAVLLKVDLSLPGTVLQSLTVTFSTATAADRQVVQAFGGLENTPAAVVKVTPEIRLEGAVIATGKVSVPVLQGLNLVVTHTTPTAGAAPFVNENTFSAGDTVAVVLGANQVSEELLTSRISRALNRLPSATNAEATRELLHIAGLRYLERLYLDRQRLSDFLQMRFQQVGGVENAIAFAGLEPQTLFDRPFVVTPGRMRINANPTSLPVELNRPDQSTSGMRVAWQLHNDASSALEHEVWEEMALVPAISTIRVLQAALRNNIAIKVISRGNAAELASLEVPAAKRQTLQQRINEGATITVPQRPVTIGTWKGLGWIEEYESWSFAYLIDLVDVNQTGTAPGGDTGGNPPQPKPPQKEPGAVGSATATQGSMCGDPVNVSNGNLFDKSTDYFLRGPGLGILFQRTYNSLSLADGPLGPGWRHSYQVSLRDAGASVTVVNETGGTMSFPLVSGAYVSPPGYNLKLTKDTQGYLLRYKNGVESRFDARGVLQTITDRNQNGIQLSYDGDRLRQVRDRAGRGVTLSYDGRGRLTGLEDFTGRRVSYEYDAAGRLSTVSDLAGSRTAYAYYTDRIFNHLLKSVTTAEGRVTAWEYYGNGKVSRVTNPDGRTMSFLYLPLRNETHVINPEGLLTSFQYNALGNVVHEIRPDGSYIESSYSADAKLEARTDAAGYTTRFTYDAAGNLTSTTDPLGRTVKFTYEPVFNQVTSIQDARGNLTRLEYDSGGNLTRLLEPLGTETRYTWDGAGNMTSFTDPEGSTFTLVYDQLGNLAEARDALGNVTRMEYDRLSRRTRTLDALGGETRREYDALDRVVRVVDQLGRVAAETYDREGRPAQRTDLGGRTTKFSYDRMGHLSQVTDALNQLTQYAHATPECGCPASPNLLRFRDAAGFTRSQTYDFQDRLVATADALGNQIQYSYDARGNLVRKIDANGNATTFEYDAAGQLIRKAFSDGTEVRFTYDGAGNLLSAGNAYVWLTFTYDELNRVTSVTDSRLGKIVRYSYNGLGRRTALMDPEGGVTSYAWDAHQRLTSITAPSGVTARFVYDALGRTTALEYSNGTSASLRFDAAGQVLEVAHSGAAGTGPRFTYAYDNAGNRITVSDAAGTHAYQYDALDRLTGAWHDPRPAEAYTYDAAGNRTGSVTDASYRYDSAGRLVAAEGATFTYDKNGNLTSRTTASGKTTYAWDLENRLVRVDLPDGGTASYRYDPFGRRIEKNVNGAVTAYLYDGNALLMELDGAGQMTARYTHGPAIDWPLVMERDGQTFFYHADALGSVAALTDSSGSVVRWHTYDSWGRQQSTEATGPANPFLFAGREYDAETGLYYLRARYYDPGVGRFISADPLDLPGLLATGQSPRYETALLPMAAAWALRGSTPGLIAGLRYTAQEAPQQLNAYAYAMNNPLRLRDPSGLHICGRVLVGDKPEDQVWEVIEYENLAALDAAIEAAIHAKDPDYDYAGKNEGQKNWMRQKWLEGWRPAPSPEYNLPNNPPAPGWSVIATIVR